LIPAMSTALDQLEPQAVWKHFAALAAIPRASEKEAAARNYVLALAAVWASNPFRTPSAIPSSASPRAPDAKPLSRPPSRATWTWFARELQLLQRSTTEPRALSG